MFRKVVVSVAEGYSDELDDKKIWGYRIWFFAADLGGGGLYEGTIHETLSRSMRSCYLFRNLRFRKIPNSYHLSCEKVSYQLRDKVVGSDSEDHNDIAYMGVTPPFDNKILEKPPSPVPLYKVP